MAPAPIPAAALGNDSKSWIGVRVEPGSLRITQLVVGAPGSRGGLAIGDTLVTLDGLPIPSSRDFVQRVRETKPGQRLVIALTRNGVAKTLSITVEPRPESPAMSSLLGKPAPAFAATALIGSVAPKLADLRGHVVVLDFWATWCGPCSYTIPRLNELHHKHAAAGLRIVGFSGEDPDVIRAFGAKLIDYTIAHDPDDAIAKSYLREGIPMFVVIDKAGVIRNVVVGADVDAVAAAVAPLLAAP